MRIFHQWPLMLQIASVVLVSELLFSWAGRIGSKMPACPLPSNRIAKQECPQSLSAGPLDLDYSGGLRVGFGGPRP